MRKPTQTTGTSEQPTSPASHYYTSKNGMGPEGALEMLQDHLTNLVAAYAQKGMSLEASIFQEHLDYLLKRTEKEDP